MAYTVLGGGDPNHVTKWGAHVANLAAARKLLRIFQTLLRRKLFPCDAKPQSALQLGVVFVRQHGKEGSTTWWIIQFRICG